ncbi:MAG: Na(+)-translocating NADH-quinone reductase subunit A [Muribaculaceae bacterium]|nr:Na(+)-translocating NADH-quinone reductase subunit A [Muribaculaceae bacterium]
MSNKIRIKRGLDIPLAGSAQSRTENISASLVGIVPDDFPGYKWKAVVKPGDRVKSGSALLISKETEDIRLVSPVSGTVREIRRGERRKIEFVSVESDEKNESEAFDSKELLLSMKRSGLYAMMRQRPFDIVPFDGVKPRDIFVTAFDTAPLAADMSEDPLLANLEAGLKALSALTDGKVYLSVPCGSKLNSKYAEVYEFEGPHPAGLVGTQIAAIRPVNKGEVVWTLDAVTVSRIGILAQTGKPDYTARVAVTGPCVKDPHIVATTIGADMATILKGNIEQTEGKVRIISGNVLTGVHIEGEEGFLRFPYRQITIIPEGDEADEFMGWASINPKKYSVKHSFPAFLRGLSKPFDFDARIKGGHRAMILSGEYDKVFPMDIYPEYLLKAIMAGDIERMEQLGIYEVAPEDFALAEFVDTSKIELQKIVREGLDYLRNETL